MRWMLAVLALVSLAGVAGWLVFQSSFLAVSEVVIEGDIRSRAREIVAAEGVGQGIATIRVRPNTLEEALRADPWIAAADVRVTWPGTVDVVILEHTPAAWVQAGEEWLLTSTDGVAVERHLLPRADSPRIEVGTTAPPLGTAVDATALAALEFVSVLPDDLADGAVVRGSGEALLGLVAGYEVVLGYPGDMTAKAAALVALLEAGVAEGAKINVVAPDRPAVKGQPLLETSEEVLGDA
jgi:cell division protein FtsQ